MRSRLAPLCAQRRVPSTMEALAARLPTATWERPPVGSGLPLAVVKSGLAGPSPLLKTHFF
eukprot:8339901-Alexandrium_andersonii.AAC.1